MEKYKLIRRCYDDMLRGASELYYRLEKERPSGYIYSHDLENSVQSLDRRSPSILGGIYTLEHPGLQDAKRRFYNTEYVEKNDGGLGIFKEKKIYYEIYGLVNQKRVGECPYKIGQVVKLKILENNRPWALDADAEYLKKSGKNRFKSQDGIGEIRYILNDYFVYVDFPFGHFHSFPFHWWDFVPVDNPDFVRVPIIKTP